MSISQNAPQLPEERMAEAEVALRLAFHLLGLPGAELQITVSLDDYHVESKSGTVFFPIVQFLTSEGWRLDKQEGKRHWQGTYIKNDCRLFLSPDSHGGDVLAKVGSKRIRVECKKGPLVKKEGNPENRLVHEAIGQLMTIEVVEPDDILVVAVPSSKSFRGKLAWQERELMKRAGITLVLVGRDGTVEGMPILS